MKSGLASTAFLFVICGRQSFCTRRRISRLADIMSVVSEGRRNRTVAEFHPLDANKKIRILSQISDPTCQGCGYSLRGLSVPGSCPECGLSYDKDILSAPIRVPRLGWALLFVPLLAYILAFPILSRLGLLGYVANLFFIAWFYQVNKCVSAWRYDLRFHGFLQGTCRKPSPKYRANLERLLLVVDALVIFGLLWFGGPLFESP